MSLSRMEETGPDKKLVKIFSRADERSAAHVFVGREDTIQAIDTNCRIAMWRVERGQAAEGKTFLVQGAPGAGKTSLMSRIKELWAGRKREAPYVLDLTTDELSDVSQPIRRIVSTVRSEWWQGVRNCFGVREAEADAAALASAGIEGKDKEGIGSFGIPAKSIPPKKWKKPLCIIVDEIQNVSEEHAACIRVLHEGRHGLPIVPIYAGLADSTSVLVNLGISRTQIDNSHILGALSSSEVKSCVRQMLDRCRIGRSDTQLERITKGIAERSEGWPQHVHTETAALFWGLHRADCDLDKVDHDAVDKRAWFYREASYSARRSPEMSESIHLVAKVLAELPKAGLHRSQALDSIKDKARPAGPTAWRIPEGMNANQFLDHLIRKGILQPDKNDILTCPIPILRTWLMEQADTLQALPASASPRRDKRPIRR